MGGGRNRASDATNIPPFFRQEPVISFTPALTATFGYPGNLLLFFGPKSIG